MTDHDSQTTKTLRFIELEMEAAHALKELRLHAPLHVSIIRKYINVLKRKARHV
jgi:hypothetical protein